MSEATSTIITKQRVKDWGACESGYRWFLENYKPEPSAEFVPLYQHLVRDKRGDDAHWLMGKLFEEISDASQRVKLVAQIAGADAKLIAEQHAAGAPNVTTDDGANAATTGNWANAATTGDGAVSAALGSRGKAKAGAGGAIVIAWRDNDGKLLGVKAAMVGQDGIKPDTWYSLDEAGNFVESEED